MKDNDGLLIVIVLLFGVGVVAWLLLRPQQGTVGPQKLSFCEQAVGGATAIGTGVASKGKMSVDNAKTDSAICSILNSIGAKVAQIGKGVALAPSALGSAVTDAPHSLASLVGLGSHENDFAKLDCATLRNMCTTSMRSGVFTSWTGKNSPACEELKRRCP